MLLTVDDVGGRFGAAVNAGHILKHGGLPPEVPVPERLFGGGLTPKSLTIRSTSERAVMDVHSEIYHGLPPHRPHKSHKDRDGARWPGHSLRLLKRVFMVKEGGQ